MIVWIVGGWEKGSLKNGSQVSFPPGEDGKREHCPMVL